MGWSPVPMHESGATQMTDKQLLQDAASDGGSAFPTSADNGHSTNQDGMTMRDYFAAKAMQGIIASGPSNFTHANGENIGRNLSLIGSVSYEIADVMLEARAAAAIGRGE